MILLLGENQSWLYFKGCALGSGWGRPLGGVRSPLGGSSFELVLSEVQLLHGV